MELPIHYPWYRNRYMNGLMSFMLNVEKISVLKRSVNTAADKQCLKYMNSFMPYILFCEGVTFTFSL